MQNLRTQSPAQIVAPARRPGLLNENCKAAGSGVAGAESRGVRPEPDRPTATRLEHGCLEDEVTILWQEHGPENARQRAADKSVSKSAARSKEPSDLDQPKFFELVVSLLVIMLLAVAAVAYQVNEMLEPLFSMVERLVRWMLGG